MGIYEKHKSIIERRECLLVGYLHKNKKQQDCKLRMHPLARKLSIFHPALLLTPDLRSRQTHFQILQTHYQV